MWQAEHAAVMCRALQGHAAALPRALAAQSSSNRPAASLALLHSVSRAWCWVVAALEPHTSALRLYDRGEGTVLTVRPADPFAIAWAPSLCSLVFGTAISTPLSSLLVAFAFSYLHFSMKGS